MSTATENDETTTTTNNKNNNNKETKPPDIPSSTSYYEQGNEELAIETPVMQKRLETRRSLTAGAGERLLIVLVGLPARGKSFIARKLLNFLVWRGNQCRIFNVGKYRRQQKQEQDNWNNKMTHTADFFDDSNQAAALARQEAAERALKDTLAWLDVVEEIADSSFMTYSARRQFHRIAIYDATNSTQQRRQWILEECAATAASTGVLFLESICDDEELLQENFQAKITSCPDFTSVTPEEALRDLKSRIQNYERRYETIAPDSHESYIKLFNLGSRVMVNHVYGRLAKVVLPAIMAWNTGSRPVYLCRPGETHAMEIHLKQLHRQQQQKSQQNTTTTTPQQQDHSNNNHRISYPRKRSDPLGPRGHRFRDILGEFIVQEGSEFMKRKNETRLHPRTIDTGTSIAGLNEKDDEDVVAFPCLVMSSTLTRAIQTATWKHPMASFPVKDVTNLNPLDMGDFAGMDLATIREQHPSWYQQLQREPLHTRFPGGESYGDLIDRLYPIIIDMEQQLGLAVVVAHVSVLQVLVAYFRSSSPVQQAMDIEIPMHTVFKFAPLRGGGWLESQHMLLPEQDALELSTTTSPTTNETQSATHPIWGDSRSCLPNRLLPLNT